MSLDDTMEIVTGAMRTLLPKLATLLTYKLQRGVRGEILFLKAELESMQVALERMSMAPVTDKQVRIWARDVRELSYDIEDSVDKFMVRTGTNNPLAKPGGFGGFIHRSMKLLTTAGLRHKIATDIRGIRELVHEVAARRDRYTINNVPAIRSDASTVERRLMGLCEEPAKLVGISGPKEDIATLLMEPETIVGHHLKVVSIVGVGGLGKTTLANAVYQQLRGLFECHAFVAVSLNPDLKRILGSILRQVSGQNYCGIETWEVEEIINKIRLSLKDKRYIIVLDDIWDKSAWEHIKCALADNSCGSRVITTSRAFDVADGIIYKMKPLSHDDSKKLFYNRIFGCEDGCHSALKEISEKILKKCDGVPLAIITVASLLASKPRDIDKWYAVHDSIGFGHEKSSGLEKMRKILSISYYDLPSHLKACLLYISIFPEDHYILKDQLLRRWISEGFIPEKDVDASYELAEYYFNELINRSLIIPEHIDTHGRVQACRVHDMILDLITSLSYEENFVTSMVGQQSTHLPNKIRRLSLQSNADEHSLQGAMNLHHLRSLVIFPHAANLLPCLSSLLTLRILDLEGCQGLEDHQLDGLVNLFHLRCLILKDTNIANIPKEIGNLCWLQTLDLRNTRITELPSTAVHLRQLVRLYIETLVMVPVGFGSMKFLQALSYICLDKCPYFIKELGNLTELRVLSIDFSGTWIKSYEECLINSLGNLKKLREFRIHASRVSTQFISDIAWFPKHLKSFTGGHLSIMPRWINSSLLCLINLQLTVDILRQKDFRDIGALPFLLYLNLSVDELEPDILVVNVNPGEFQYLVKFSFVCGALRLRFEEQSMPRIENLELAFKIQETKDFDLGLENLTSLKHATVRINCEGSTVYEVQNADAAIWKGVLKNPNHPRLDVLKHFEEDMIRDDEKLQALDESETNEEEELVVQKMGPWGGNGGNARDIIVPSHRLESVTICSGTVIDALAFSYLDRNGKQHTTKLWGGYGGTTHVIHLGPSEFLTEVTGTYIPCYQESDVITSLTLVSNERSYGPFGWPFGTTFYTQAKENHSIVGFYGRSGLFLDAIGVYVRPLATPACFSQ